MIPLTNKIKLFTKKIGGDEPFFLISGPCVIENYELLETVAKDLNKLKEEFDIDVIFKASYDKANRSSIDSFRGPGIEQGLEMLHQIKLSYNLPILTDVHTVEETKKAAKVVDFLQIPAFLSRQTDILIAAGETGKWINVKKGQFIAPEDSIKIVEKIQTTGNNQITLCERGYTFGYNNLVVDMRSFEILRKKGIYMVMDATHSTQLPGGGESSGGQREMAYPLARAATAVGLDGFFFEAHPNPPQAKSDATNQIYLDQLIQVIKDLLEIDALVKKRK